MDASQPGSQNRDQGTRTSSCACRQTWATRQLQAILCCVLEAKRTISDMAAICILECLKAIGPVTVAIAVFIATCWFYRWQIRLAKQKLRHDLYERRFAIYAAFRELLLAFIEKDNDEKGNGEIMAAFQKASMARFEARFVLDDPKIDATLDALCKQATADVSSNIEYFDAMKPQGTMNDPQIRRDFSERADRLGKARLDLVGRYFEELPKQFEKHLKLTDFWK